jgi:hypothetical protein
MHLANAVGQSQVAPSRSFRGLIQVGKVFQKNGNLVSALQHYREARSSEG